MRFHLVDRIVTYEPRTSVHAIKLTSRSEEHWVDGPDGAPVMPPPLVLEAFCQAGTWLIVASTDRRLRAALLQVGEAEWLRDVRPGDTLDIRGECVSFGEETAVLSGTVSVGEEVVLRCEDVMCALIDVGTLADPDDTRRLLETITREEAAA